MASNSAPIVSPATSKPGQPATRQDMLALWGGVAFSVLFTAVIWWLGPRLDAVVKLPDAGATWYYWKLPEPTFWSRATAWGFYLFHQVTIWALIFMAQKERPKYGSGLNKFNVMALGANAIFATLHLVQTHLWYDGLAQDVHIYTSQWSVILMLVIIVLMENPRRGMFFGKKAPLSKRVTGFFRTYHGYIFSWAIIYTFWYHPAEYTSGHLLGFFYTLLLMLQGSLFFTKAHLNRWWGFTLETLVLIHGTTVALSNAPTLWQMFGFGFAGIVVVTSMYGLGLPRWVRLTVIGVYVGAILWVYSSVGYPKIHQVTWIPFTYYATALVLALLVWAGLWVNDRVRGTAQSGLTK